MKKLFLSLIAVMVFCSISKAASYDTDLLNQASFTKTNEGPICISSGFTRGGYLVGVVIGSQSALGTLTLADAYVSTTGNTVSYATFSILSLSGGNAANSLPTYVPYGIRLSSGLMYTTSNNTNVTIIWKSYRPQ